MLNIIIDTILDTNLRLSNMDLKEIVRHPYKSIHFLVPSLVELMMVWLDAWYGIGIIILLLYKQN